MFLASSARLQEDTVVYM